MNNIIFNMDDSGSLSVDIFHLIHELPENRILELFESLSCADVVINHVMDQVLHGCTENGFSGSWSTSYGEPLQKYRLEIAKHSSEIAKKEIETLKTRLADVTADRDKYQNDYYDIYHKNMRGM